MDEPGPVSKAIADIVNEARLTTVVELKRTVDGDATDVTPSEAIEYLLALNAALIGACMRLAGELDDLHDIVRRGGD